MIRSGIVSCFGAFGFSCIAQPSENHPTKPEGAPHGSAFGQSPGTPNELAAPHFPPLTLTRNLQGDAGVSSSVQPDAGNIENAAKVVAAMRPGFRACYETALTRYRGFSASVRLSMRIGADGAIVHVTGVGTNAPAEVIECLFDEVARHRFEPPMGGAAVVNVPVNLVAK